jgi:hypothetical protein
MIFSLLFLFARGIQAENEFDMDIEDEPTVSILITKFDVNDTTLELSWKIRNDTDHDIWICKGINPAYTPIIDLFLDKDAKTLVIRRRFNLLLERQSPKPFIAKYVRLRPVQEMAESVSIALPVEPDTIFNLLRANAEFAESLSIEIGFYNEDLPGLILKIVDLAEKLSCDIGLHSPIWDFNDTEVSRRFFGGVYVARFFYLESFGYFRNSVTSGGDEVLIPYMRQTLGGEHILRAKVNNVLIPYESNYPPLTSKKSRKTDGKQVKLLKDQKKNQHDLEDGQDQSTVAKK